MEEWILAGVAGVVLSQILLGIYVHVDANRRNLEQLGLYFYGVTIPLAGLLIAGVYFSHRDQLPTQDLSVPQTTGTDSAVTWTVEHRGLRRLPLRLGCAIQFGQTFWRVGVVAPVVFLALAVVVHPAAVLALLLVCQVYWFTYLQGASHFTDTTVRLAPDEQRIETTTRGGGHPLSFGGSEDEIDLRAVQKADLRQVRDQPIIAFQYDNPLASNPWLVPVGPAHVEDTRQLLAAQEIPLRDHLRDGTNSSLVRRRTVATACALVAVPFVAGPRWSAFFLTGPMIPFFVFVFLWLILKPFA